MTIFSLTQQTLLSLAGLAMSLIVIVLIISFYETEAIIKKDISDKLNIVSNDRIRYVQDIWELRLVEASLIAEIPLIRETLKTYAESLEGSSGGGQTGSSNSNNLNNEISAQLQSLKTYYDRLTQSRDDSAIRNLVLVGKDNKVIFSASDVLLDNESFSPLHRHLHNNNDRGEGDGDNYEKEVQDSHYFVEHDHESGLPMIVLTMPVMEDDGERHHHLHGGMGDSEDHIIGTVRLVRDISKVDNFLSRRTGLGETGETYLVNNERHMITSSRFVVAADDKFSKVIDTLAVQECFENEKNVNAAIYPDYRGVLVYGTSICEPEKGIMLVTEVAKSEVEKPLTDLFYHYIILAALLLALTISSSFIISRGLLAPIRDLSRRARQISEGKLDDVKFDHLDRPDDIGILAKSLSGMVTKLLDLLSKSQQLARNIEISNKRLKSLDDLKTEFIGVASHELRTPVQPILGYVELAKKGYITSEQALEGIQKHARHLRQLSSDILDVSRIESGNMEYSFERIKICALLQEVVAAARVNPNRSKEVEIKAALDDDAEVMADRIKLLQVFSNIVDNAIKFTERGVIQISSHVDREKKQVQVRISDTGQGISDKILDRLFDRFATFSKGNKKGGTGLGLYICKAVVNAHKGEIVAKNNSEEERGKGATFTVMLPIINT